MSPKLFVPKRPTLLSCGVESRLLVEEACRVGQCVTLPIPSAAIPQYHTLPCSFFQLYVVSRSFILTREFRPADILLQVNCWRWTIKDLDLERRVIHFDETCDDNNRAIRDALKTEESTASLPMPSALRDVLWNYLKHHWKPNDKGFLFPNPDGTKPRRRDNVVRYGLNRF